MIYDDVGGLGLVLIWNLTPHPMRHGGWFWHDLESDSLCILHPHVPIFSYPTHLPWGLFCQERCQL